MEMYSSLISLTTRGWKVYDCYASVVIHMLFSILWTPFYQSYHLMSVISTNDLLLELSNRQEH